MNSQNNQNSMLPIENKPHNSSASLGMSRDSNASKNSINSFSNPMDTHKPDPYSNTNQSMNSNNNGQIQSMMESTVRDQEKMVQSRKDDIAVMSSTHNSNNQLLKSLKEKSEQLRKELDRLNAEYKNMRSKVTQQNTDIHKEVNQIADLSQQIAKTAR
jgi:uncharacterized protein involved in exopolysaccharide biosynthesis